MTEHRRLVERDAHVDDPELSRDANERLSPELGGAVGEQYVGVPEPRTALTSSSAPSAPSETGIAPLALPILVVAGSLAVGIVAAANFGGVAWIGALLLLGAAVGWSLLEIEVARDGKRDERAFEGDAAASRTRLIPTLVVVAAVVASGVIIVGALVGYL